MGILEIIADQNLGSSAFKKYPSLRTSLGNAERTIREINPSKDEKIRIASLVNLCFEYDRETDLEEKEIILRTLAEISANEALELPDQDLEKWEADLKSTVPDYAKADKNHGIQTRAFLKKYFSLRAKAGLQTQTAVAKASGLKRGYVAVIETGEHFPQQKTLQKLAKAFAVDVTELLP